MFLGKMTRAGLGMIAALGLSTSIASAQESVEVLHWWTAGGEAKALQVLKKDLEGQGVSWNDMPVAGGGGEQAMTVLRARVTSGNAPTAVQMLGFDIKDWAGEGVLANLDELASKEGWDAVVPDALKGFSKYDGHWIAAPVNVHSTNWVWANKAIFDELGLKQPGNWDELIAALDKIKAAGYTAVAHGGQAWQDATIFDAVVMATGGPDFYQASMIDTDPDALGSDTMKTVFERMAKLRSYVDDNFSGRDWNLATAMVINKEAGVQFMGDWAKGEFLNAGKVPDQDFMCFRFPGTQDAVTFNSDQFVMFKVGEDRQDAQMKLASAVMSPTFQSAFNVVKGSVPARTDVPNDAFDACGKKGMAELAAANKKGTLFGSMAHGHSVPAGVKNAMYDVITAHFNGEYDAETAVEELVNAVESAQ
ncbi:MULTISPECIES: ABC transporter substrate-binding protein [Thalassospira]|jgi:glucose/mannose transport system substrate-binding protein|uniref:Probable sugar-binding periplasmic protein n=1 Tax=Thalassospira povalilytica TaxID=732237 RepID=A0A8I1M6P6_9PROT|nr:MULTISPECIES: ABC transporter substrate-binding protein [Thalassospira]MAL41305.1 sugar ABC transporter substrate-binding protein [Thalassospira sp.]MBN8196171.1 carbohydrate ABC transporter substrate-binding protein [Thalassospira povalilytica]MBO6772538.1 carbohydrate ABC transporter substrate-binding protein [Thalassospira sp.]MCC4242245.1 ABC transporter substrate-binding protein [Thalassospira povalilytica]PKR52592.1 sugar ABC transporter substrate-binding protein [Thalassospira povali|tara:strand:- start:2254 stop:3513 length:1260 start_codon:yes stop_codon:yes gene_type:complete